MCFRIISTGTFLFPLAVAASCALSGRSWAYSESGPELIAPDTVLMTPTVDPAPRPEGDSQTHATNSVQNTPALIDQATSGPALASPPAFDDGWVTKGSRPQTRSPSAGTGSAARSSFAPPPASLPGTHVMPQPSVPAPQNVSQGTVLPYPYGAPAPVPEYLGHPQASQNGPILRQLMPAEREPTRSGGVLASVGRWWDSLWGKKPMDASPSTSFGSGSLPNGWSPGISPNLAVSTPWTTTGPVTPGPGASPGATAASAVQPYATPYALPPKSGEGSPVFSLPLTADPSQPTIGRSLSASTYGSAVSASSGTTSSSTSGMPSPPANGQSFASPGSSNFGVYDGWSATQPLTSGVPSNRSLATSTLPPYPHYSSGFGTAMPFPSASQPRGAFANGSFLLPRQEGASPSLIDRFRKWWADVTAPKGIQGRQALLPSAPGNGKLLGAGFRGRSPAVPPTDPFSSYGGAPAGAVSVPSPGVGVASPSPAVLPPPAPQLPLRQAW